MAVFNNNKVLKITFKKILFPLLILVVVIIFLIKFSELQEIGRLFTQAKWSWLVLAFVSQIINFIFQTEVYRKSFNILKLQHINFFRLMKMVVVVVFLNFTIPSLSFAGNIFLVKSLKKFNLKEGRALTLIILEFITYYLGLIILLIFSLSYLFFKLGNIGYAQKIAVIVFAAILIFIIWMLYFWLGNKTRSANRVLWFYNKFYQADGKIVDNGISAEKKVEHFLIDFYKDVDWIKNNKTQLVFPVLLQLLKFIFDGLTIFLIFLAFGVIPPFGLPIAAFVFGRLFGLISFIPGGLGAFEGAMVLTLNSLGTPLELAISVMLIYRFYSYWLYFPLGLMFYKQLK